MKIKYKRTTVDTQWATGKSEHDLYNFLTTIKDHECVVVRIDCEHKNTYVEARLKRCRDCHDVLGESEEDEKKHVNIENDEVTIPYYAVHADGKIFGFFGPFHFLSNFFILENGVSLDDVYYPSVEHAYQAAKWPYNEREQFLGVSAGGAKKLGKQAPTLNVRKWDKQKVGLMAALCRQKFLTNPKLKEMLLMTDGCQLEERNSWGDREWGADVNGVGENQLGKILMNIRHDLLTKKEMF